MIISKPIISTPFWELIVLFCKTLSSFIQRCFMPSFVWIRPAVLENFFFQFQLSLYNCYFVIMSLLERVALHLNKLESPSPKTALCQILLKLAQWSWRRRWKCEKDGDGQQAIRKDHMWFQLRWANKHPSSWIWKYIFIEQNHHIIFVLNSLCDQWFDYLDI